jgi:tetratricopeptide (TPR) repeat protein
MKRLLQLLTICIFTFPLPALTQIQSNEELFYDALFFYEDEEDYEEAAYLFKQLLEREPENANVMFHIGMSYNHIQGEEAKGIPYFVDATKNINLKYKGTKYSEKGAPHHTWFYLAEAYRLTNQMNNALEALRQFQSLDDFEKHYNLRITEDAILAVERAKIIRDAELNLRALYFNEPINTPENDYCGVISADGNMMVWVNSKAFYEAVYMSTRQEENNWSIPVLITPQIVSDGDLFPTGLSADGNTLLLVKSPESGDKDIYFSQFDGLIWSSAQPLPGAINSKSDEAHASFSPDGTRIYFSSDRRGGYGGLDIWYSDRQPDGHWGEPVNMGDVINTELDETSAYIAPAEGRFIFSSQGHFNMGGFDIFRCELEVDGRWGEPSNIGYPINTTGDNTYYVPLNDGLSGLATRFTNDAIGKNDLWYVEILGEEGIISNAMTELVNDNRLSSKNFALILIDEETGEEIELIYDAETDSFRALAGPGKSYRIISYKAQ